ncbi:Fic family protein [Streptomyces sp. NPDC126514]|uniref:Fic family protein n=1 Tax=Streptomyces sp. NPDC126514 TaxID=3155210 RepID=UPI00331EF6F4
MTGHLTVAEAGTIARIAFGGRDPEVRDAGLFASAVRRPRARMSGTRACVEPYEQAAAILHALATNHPLADGDKRTARLAPRPSSPSTGSVSPTATRTRRTTWSSMSPPEARATSR